MSKNSVGFSIVGSILCILFFLTVNLSTNSMAGIDNLWFIYPTFFVLWWPLSIIFAANSNLKAFSVVGSISIIVFLIAVNYTTSSCHPWFLYAVFPVVWWPVTMFAGERAKSIKFALIGSASTILYYTLLNLWISPNYPWAVFPAYAVIWWPMSMYFGPRKKYFALSVMGSFVTILFFTIVNYISSPSTIWAIYPIFAVIWWPLSLYYFHYKKRLKF